MLKFMHLLFQIVSERINNFFRSSKPDYIDEILNFADEKEIEDSANKGDKDELYNQALEMIDRRWPLLLFTEKTPDSCNELQELLI